MALNVLHLASFSGNVGDIVNHTAMHEIFKSYSQKTVLNFREIEMRYFYRNSALKKFDEKFLTEINNHSAFILGGGNFFDVRWNESVSGTTLDMQRNFMDGIRIPVIINAMGFMNYYPQETYRVASDNFLYFLREAVKLGWKIFLRNDGSRKRILSLYGTEFKDSIMTVPDAAFLFNKIRAENKLKKEIVVGINCINELFDLKFTKGYGVDDFNKEFGFVINDLLQRGIKIILFAHTPQDLDVINFLKHLLDEKYFRYQISIAPYSPNSLRGALDIDRYYSMCDAIIGMRFHACVLGLKNNVPVLSLAVNTRMSDFFDELKLEGNCIPVCKDFSDRLKEKIFEILNTSECQRQLLTELNRKIEIDYRSYAQNCMKFLEEGVWC